MKQNHTKPKIHFVSLQFRECKHPNGSHWNLILFTELTLIVFIDLVCRVLGLVAQSCLTLCDPSLKPARLLSPWGFSRQKYWSGLPCPSPGDLPKPGIELRSLTLQADSLPTEPPGKPLFVIVTCKILLWSYFGLKSEGPRRTWNILKPESLPAAMAPQAPWTSLYLSHFKDVHWRRF